jgi:HK97 family phage major capsid protein
VAKSILGSLAQGDGDSQPKGKATHKVRDAQGTKSLGDFLISVVDQDSTRLKTVYGSEIVETLRGKSRRKDLSGDTGAAGAYLIPPEYVPEILTVDPLEAIIRPSAHIQPMAADTLKLPKLAVTAAPSAGATYHFGGVLAYWTEEAEETTETEPGFKQMELRAHKLGGHTQITEELYDDEGIGLSALLKRLFGGAITWVEDYSFIRGPGGGQPLGILNADAKLTQARATASTFKLEDAANMLGKFMPQSFGKGVWIMNITVLPKLIQLTDGTNVVWIPNAREGLPVTLFGMPVLFTDKNPALGTEGDVILADWSYYVLGDRQRLAIAASEHYDFLKGLITVRFTHRVDGQPWLDGPIYIDDTNKISPFVVLTDAS